MFLKQVMHLVACAGTAAAGVPVVACAPELSHTEPPRNPDPPASGVRNPDPPAPGFHRGHATPARAAPSELARIAQEYASQDLACPAESVKVGQIWGSHIIADGCGRRAVYMQDGGSVYLLSIVPLKEESPGQ